MTHRKNRDLEATLAAANARIAELEADYTRERKALYAQAVAANARVAELERECGRMSLIIEEKGRAENVLLSKVSAANARADAAERHLEQHRQEDPHELLSAQRQIADLESQCRALSEDRSRAESERAEWEAKCDAAERRAAVACDHARSFAEAADRAESEAAQWKAEYESAMRRALDSEAAHEQEAEALHKRLDQLCAEAEALRAEAGRLGTVVSESGRTNNVLRAAVEGLRTGAVEAYRAR